MVQIINQQGHISGRIGEGFAKGLAEQVPKEIDRYRLSKGLQDLGEEKGLSPYQRFAKLSSIPGVTPQMIQSGSELLKQEGVSNALRSMADKEKETLPPAISNPFKKEGQTVEKKNPSLTTHQGVQSKVNSFIPKTFEQIRERAGELMNENPALYGNDPDKAIAAATQEEFQNEKINLAEQTRNSNRQSVMDNVESSLRKQSNDLKVDVPPLVYSDIEDKAINSVKPIEEGGEGLTEQQAKKKYGKELDEVSRDYSSVDALGNWGMVASKPGDTKRTIKNLQKKFKDRKELENFADTLIGKNGISPSKAWYLADPVSDHKELNNIVAKLPEIMNTRSEDPTFETNKIAPKLFEKLGEGSPLAVAEELKSRGYDPDAWLDYVSKHKHKLKTASQERQLDKPRNFFDTLNDNWLFYFSGLDNLVEQ